MAALVGSASMASLNADDGPLWFKPDTFLDPKFDPNSYVNDLKRYVSLGRLARSQMTMSRNLNCSV